MISDEGIKRIVKSASALYDALLAACFTDEAALKLTIAAMPALVGRV